MINVQRIKCGNGNCYLVREGENSILVDTARSKYRDEILKQCEGQNVRLIVLTHAHVDHCQNAGYLSEKLGVPVAMAKEDMELLHNNMNQSLFAHTLLGKLVLALSLEAFKTDEIEKFEPAVILKEGDSLRDYGISANVIALPGHTDGSIGLELEDHGVMVGDALMNMFYPTISMLYHNREQMMQSAKRISALGKRTIYFGHGKEKRNRCWVS